MAVEISFHDQIFTKKCAEREDRSRCLLIPKRHRYRPTYGARFFFYYVKIPTSYESSQATDLTLQLQLDIVCILKCFGGVSKKLKKELECNF